MGKLFPRLIGLFSKLEGGKHQVGSEAEVGNQYKRRERSKWKGPFGGTLFRAQTHVYGFCWDA